MKKITTVLVVLMTMLCSTIMASAAADPAVTIVNPADKIAVNSDSLLVSVKVTQPKVIQISVSEKKQTVDGKDVSIDVNQILNDTTENGLEKLKNSKNVEVCKAENFTCSNNLSFYTKQINNLNPGVYEIKVKTLDSAGKTIYSSTSLVAMMGKQSAEDQDKLIDAKQNGALQFFQNLFKSFFS